MQGPVNDTSNSNYKNDLTVINPRKNLVSVGGYASQESAASDDNIDLKQYWFMLLRHRAIIFNTFWIVTLVALIVTYLITPIYKSTLVLQIDTELTLPNS